MTSTATAMLTFDEILEQGSPTQETVWLCLNGRLRAEYEEIAERMDRRRADRDTLREAAADRQAALELKATEPSPDDRLTSKPKPADDAEPEVPDEASYVDPEQERADQLIAEMRRFTVPFVLATIGGDAYNDLIGEHPPRRDPTDAKKIDTRDLRGFNVSTFFRALVRLSIVSPDMTDERWEKLKKGPARLSDIQFDRLADAAVRVNRQDYDLPFSPDESETPPR